MVEVTNYDFPCPAWKIAIGSLTASALADGLTFFLFYFFFYIRCIILRTILRMQPLGYSAIVLYT